MTEEKDRKRPNRPINLAYRDGCERLLEALNYVRGVGRIAGMFRGSVRRSGMVGEGGERSGVDGVEYEQCQYEAFKERVRKEMEKERTAM
ncbi:hypothetical protein PORY_000368 [Pneumocystis oryctolagi]|uniref:Uncharacterized protein n=1 Tax=Pneumocystis oryctolagi TaxID=42067 RepID=A0ACB7CFR2_9ASCO|nr:hypothetical protein PORY_000368 [Pneumocystis oryctolagi]